MQRSKTCLIPVIVAGAVIMAANLLSAQTITFRKIADTGTPIPDGTGSFTAFPTLDNPIAPSIDGGDVVFAGAGSGGQLGIYTEIGGVLDVVADTNTPIPDGTGNFTSLNSPRVRSRSPSGPSMGGGRVAFIGTGSSGQVGVYTNIGGVLRAVADTNTPITDGAGNFANFDFVSTDGVNVAFLGLDDISPVGVYAEIGGTLVVIADTNTVAPGGTYTFISLEGASIDVGDVAFFGFAPGRLGIFTNIGGVLAVAADTNTPIPGGTENFAGFSISSSISGGNVVFVALNSMTELGVYSNIGGSLRVVVDGNTVLPGGIGNFNARDFGLLGSIDGENVLFNGAGVGSGVHGLFAEIGGSLIKVVDDNDMLEGKTIRFINGNTSRGDALSGNEVAFLAGFADDSQGLFVATIPLDVCGNGILEAGEECDDAGESATCDVDCTFAQCGDGTLNSTAEEQCDDGGSNSDTTPDACRTDCTVAGCGDNIIDTGEECDDGNNIDADGCQGNCLLPVCGDGIVDPGEQCDDGPNNSDTTPDACRSDCTPAACGDDVVDTGEACDDGNMMNGDGCSSACEVEEGVIPTVSEWGLILMTLLLLTIGKIVFQPRRSAIR